MKELSQLIHESIQLELNVAELYKIFNQAFKKDAVFWFELFIEEENHASLFKDMEKIDILPIEFFMEILSPLLEELKEKNKNIASFIAEYKLNPPSRETAFNVALEIEQSAGEIHFQKFMEKESKSPIVQLFQRLNEDDKNHIARLRNYMEKHDIQILK